MDRPECLTSSSGKSRWSSPKSKDGICSAFRLRAIRNSDMVNRNRCMISAGPELNTVVSLYIYRVSQEEWTKLRESVPYVELYRYNPKHLYPKLNGYGDYGHRKVWTSGVSTYCTPSVTPYSSVRMLGNETPLASILMQWPWRNNGTTAACVKYLET